MIVYRGSDVKYSWEDKRPMCDYVKEGNDTTGMEWVPCVSYVQYYFCG